MSAGWITVVVAGAVFLLADLVAAAITSVTWPGVARRFDRRSAEVAAQRAFWWRLAPFVIGTASALVAAVVFRAHEPAGVDERVSLSLCAVAGVGWAAVLASLVRVGVSLVRSQRLAASWQSGARHASVPGFGLPVWVVDSAFPIVAVVGVWPMRLVVARSVVEQCDPDELAAIAAHERRHADAADNLRQVLVENVVDGLWGSARGRAMAAAWRRFAEDAADDFAASRGEGAACLASALVKVARLAPAGPLAPVPASTFHSGGAVDRRVRRVLAERPAAGPDPWRTASRLGPPTAAATAVAAALVFGRDVYAVVEWCIATLP